MIEFLFASYGLFFLLAQSSLLSGPRNEVRIRSRFIDSMLDCAFCSGFWSGIFVFVYMFGVTPRAPLYGLASATFCLFADAFLNLMESWTSRT